MTYKWLEALVGAGFIVMGNENSPNPAHLTIEPGLFNFHYLRWHNLNRTTLIGDDMVKKFDVFNPFQKWKKGDLPVNSHISIVTNELNAEKDGRIRLTVNLATDLEIDH